MTRHLTKIFRCAGSAAGISIRHVETWIPVLIGALATNPALAATSFNASSPMGINLAQIAYYSPEQPFIDVFKTNAGFFTKTASNVETNEEKYLNLDADGWPISLTAVNESASQQFTELQTTLNLTLPVSATPVSAQYIVRYLGQGTITYGAEAVKVSSLSSPGRDVINVTHSYGGQISIIISSTDPNHSGNYIRNIQVLRSDQEAALVAGQVFNRTFLGILQNFRVLRFMDWFKTNGSTLSSWSQRPLKSNSTWASANGVPYEVAIQLANATSADAWLNVPAMADDNYITQFATLVHEELGSNQKAYVELSNEVWNSGFPQFAYANAQGKSLWASAGSAADFGNNWYGMRVAQTCDIWKSVWGADAGRVVCVMGTQAANPWTATEALSCPLWSGAPCSGHSIGAVAIAPYFGGPVPSSWTSQPDGGLNSLITSLTSQNDPSIPVGGWLGQALGWVAAYGPVVAKYKLPLISYEGGQTFVAFPNPSNSALANLYYAANRDPRMQAAYATYLQGWRKNGGELFMHYNDIFPFSQYGEWGALESITQATSPLSSAPPKWQALQNFIAANQCWWSSCSGNVASIPMAPSNLRVQP